MSLEHSRSCPCDSASHLYNTVFLLTKLSIISGHEETVKFEEPKPQPSAVTVTMRERTTDDNVTKVMEGSAERTSDDLDSSQVT